MTRLVTVIGALLLWTIPITGVIQRPAPDPNRPVSVLVLDFAGDGHQLTSAADGVLFDLDGTGKRLRVGWTAARTDDGFLFLDTNGNGRVDNGRELLGDGWRMPDGSRSTSVDATLAIIQGFQPPYSNPAPRGIGWINRDDEVYARLRVWRDSSHDGISDSSELTTLAERHIDRILLSFGTLGREADAHGNTHNFGGDFYVTEEGVQQQRKMTDLTFARR